MGIYRSYKHNVLSIHVKRFTTQKGNEMKISNEAKRLGTNENRELERAERKALREAAKAERVKAERVAELVRARHAQAV